MLAQNKSEDFPRNNNGSADSHLLLLVVFVLSPTGLGGSRPMQKRKSSPQSP